MNTAETKSEEQARRMRERWNTGDYARFSYYWREGARIIASGISYQKGAGIIDIACGNDNLTIELAKAGYRLTGIDINPNLIHQANKRVGNENLKIQYLEGNGMSLPFDNNSFDGAVSLLGIMFCPKPEVALDEVLRVLKPGGKIYFFNWTPESFFAKLLEIYSRYMPVEGSIYNPMVWGTEDFVTELFGKKAKELNLERKNYIMNYPFDVDGVLDFYLKYFPRGEDMRKMPADIQVEINKELRELWQRNNLASDGTVCVQSEYLEIIAVK